MRPGGMCRLIMLGGRLVILSVWSDAPENRSLATYRSMKSYNCTAALLLCSLTLYSAVPTDTTAGYNHSLPSAALLLYRHQISCYRQPSILVYDVDDGYQASWPLGYPPVRRHARDILRLSSGIWICLTTVPPDMERTVQASSTLFGVNATTLNVCGKYCVVEKLLRAGGRDKDNGHR